MAKPKAGVKVRRVDGPQKARGTAKYGSDINLPGLLYGALLVCPHPRATWGKVDAAAARKLPGVKAIITYDNTGTRYAGKAVASVAAVSQQAAQEACARIKVKYKINKNFQVDTEEAAGALRKGSPARLNPAFQKADAVVEATYRTPVAVHACLETHGATCVWEGDKKLKAWVSTQGVHSCAKTLSQRFGLAKENVQVITQYMGGGFGSKISLDEPALIAARLAKIAKAPVRLFLPRGQDFLNTGNQPASRQYYKLGGKKDGTLTAMYARMVAIGGGGFTSMFNSIYSAGAKAVDQSNAGLNAGGARPFRAPNHPAASFALESAIDLLAAKLEIDPLVVRQKNDKNRVRLAQYKIGAKAIGWSKRNKKPGGGKGRLRRGLGVGTARWAAWGGPGSTCRITADRTGAINVFIGTQDIGSGTRSLVAVAAARAIGLPMKYIHAQIGDSHYSTTPASAGSVTCETIEPAVRLAAAKIATQIKKVAARALQTGVNNVQIKDATFSRKVGNDAFPPIPWVEVAKRIGGNTIQVKETANRGNAKFGGSMAGCQFAEVEVDLETGRIRPIRIVAVHDCGLPVNRTAIESQIIGGVTMGLSLALHEERIMDAATGIMINADLLNYKIPGPGEIPKIEPIIFYDPALGMPDHPVGIGEPPIIPTMGALAGAVYNAIGVQVTTAPMTPMRVLDALEAKGGAK